MIIILSENNNKMFKNPFSFDGRIRRTEYGISVIIYAVCYSIINVIITAMASSSDSSGAVFVFFIFTLPLLFFSFAQGAKRCHDLGHNGWWQLIPFYGLWLLFQEGQFGTNQYGEDPKVHRNNQATPYPNPNPSPYPPNSGAGYPGGYSGGHNNPNGNYNNQNGNYNNPNGNYYNPNNSGNINNTGSYTRTNNGEYQNGTLYN